MINFLRSRPVIIRIFILITLILPVLVPVRSWVLAENEVHYFSSANVTYTADFGIENPEGMAYFSGANGFVLWGMNKNERMITLRTETSKKTNFAQNIANPLSVSFDSRRNSLFSLDVGKKELNKIKVDDKNTQPLLDESARFNIKSLDMGSVNGMTVDPATGQLFVLDAGKKQLVALSPDTAGGSNDDNAANHTISLAAPSESNLRGVAFNPTNSHFYLGDPDARKVHEVTKSGELVSTYDISSLNLENPSTMLFAPSQDATDDPNIMALYILDSGQPTEAGSTIASDLRTNAEKGQIVELSLQAPAALPPGTTLLPATLVRTFDTSNQAWNPSAPDPAGIDYWPAANRLVISDSEVEEMRPYWQGSNVFLSTTSGNLTGTCSTTAFTEEPTGVAINPNNNHIFIAADYQDKLFEISLGPDGQYCTSDDTVTETSLVNAYGVTDAEDVAYGNNTVFIAGGDDAEVFVIPLGADGVVGGGDDGPMTHWDTNALGFADTEGIGYNHTAGTLFVVSTKRTDKYLGEFSTSGTLLRAYSLSFMPDVGNIRSDVTYAPASQNPSLRSIYIASRGIDNDSNRNENDGQVWEISISNAVVPTATNVIVPTPTNTIVPSPTVTVPTPTTGAGSANIQVSIGSNHVGGFNVPHVGSINPSFAANNGPVKITSTNNVPVLSSMQAIWREPGYRSSYSELMGLPKEQLSTEYWFPWYNNVDVASMDQGFRIANINATGPNTIEVWVGDTMLDRFELGVAASTRVGYAVNNGPIRITCTTCAGGEKILAAMRVIWQEPGPRFSYSELMGLPKEQLSTEYWFPWYNNVDVASMDQGFRIANVDTLSHTIQVRVGSTLVESFTLSGGASVRKSYSINNGPIRIVCSNCTGSGKILAAMRVIWQEPGFRSSYTEMMGLPKEQLSKEYWFPWYNNAAPASMDQGFRIANVDTSSHTIQIWAGTALLENFTLGAGASARKDYTVVNGPIRIVCGNCAGSGKILAAMRVIWQEPGFRSSYTEMMGTPVEALSTENWFPWYNNLDIMSMNQAFRISVP